MKEKLLERFSKYLSFATTSDPNSTTYPSTNAQLLIGDFLVEELKGIGMVNVEKDQYGYVTALLPANTPESIPTIGFIAHFDTAPDMPGIAAPRIVENYNGQDIILDTETNTILSVSPLAYDAETSDINAAACSKSGAAESPITWSLRSILLNLK
mgnify:CR=1 FL=1